MMFLEQSDAAELARTGPRGDGMFAGIDPNSIAFGTPLAELFEATGHDLDRLLQAAAVAGHSPADGAGLLMTLRAAMLFWHQEVANIDPSEMSPDDFERVWRRANDLRAIVTLAEQLCARLEARAAEFWRASSSAPYERDYERCAHSCDELARRARLRGEMARADSGPSGLPA